jgi:beta-phosphoglucomutase-like phosphatase (HAD superfamily)/8-oxo-dGTP pyrophosphatase MutT (NUDIX family)
VRLPRKPAAVVFDMDGLLFDTEALWNEALLSAAAEGGHEVADELFSKSIGVRRSQCRALFLSHFGEDFLFDDFHANWVRHFWLIAENKLALKPGAPELLDTLDQLRLPHAIATSSSRTTVERHLTSHSLMDRFDEIICRGDYENGKPAPDPFLTAAERLDIEPRLCLALEDSHIGVRSAAAAGMMTVMVPDLLEPTDEIRGLCTFVASDLHEVRSALLTAWSEVKMSVDDGLDIETLGTRIVYENRWMRVREDAIRRRDGSGGIYGVVEKPDFAVIVPVEDDGRIHLVQQYRYPVQARYWEFPQGAWEETPGADPAEVARGELQEETGLIATQMVHAGHLFEAYGYSNQGYHVYIASGLQDGFAGLDHEEQDLTTRMFPLHEVERMIRDGEIKRRDDGRGVRSIAAQGPALARLCVISAMPCSYATARCCSHDAARIEPRMLAAGVFLGATSSRTRR